MSRLFLPDTWVNPRAVVFDGSASYADLPRPAELTALTQWSVSLWLAFPETPPSAPVLSLFGGAAGASGWTIDKAGTSLTYALRAHFQGAGTKTLFVLPYTITPGVWLHALLTYDGAIVRGYANGAALGTHAVAGDSLAWGVDTQLRLARRGNTYAAAALDELTLWDRAITPELVRHPARGRPRSPLGQAGLLFWWRLGDRWRAAAPTALPAAWPTGGPAWTWHNATPATQLIAGA